MNFNIMFYDQDGLNNLEVGFPAKREKRFAKKFAKCDRRFSHFFAERFVRWKP